MYEVYYAFSIIYIYEPYELQKHARTYDIVHILYIKFNFHFFYEVSIIHNTTSYTPHTSLSQNLRTVVDAPSILVLRPFNVNATLPPTLLALTLLCIKNLIPLLPFICVPFC